MCVVSKSHISFVFFPRILQHHLSVIMVRCTMYTPVLQDQPFCSHVTTDGIFNVHRVFCSFTMRRGLDVTYLFDRLYNVLNVIPANDVNAACSDIKTFTPLLNSEFGTLIIRGKYANGRQSYHASYYTYQR